MTLSATAGQRQHAAANWFARVAAVAVLGLVGLAGCGSSKPAYCSARADLENSIKGVASLSASSGINALQAQFDKIKTAADKVVSQAKSDFPTQTSAIKSSVDSLTTAVNALKANPSASQIAAVTSSATTALSSVQSFLDATKSKCS